MPNTPKALRIVGECKLEQPSFEASLAERQVIKRFLAFAQADVRFHLDAMKRDLSTTRDDLHQAENTAVTLQSYLRSLRSGVDAMTPSPAADPRPN